MSRSFWHLLPSTTSRSRDHHHTKFGSPNVLAEVHAMLSLCVSRLGRSTASKRSFLMLDTQTVFWHEPLSLILGYVALGLLGVLSVIVTAGMCKPSLARFVLSGQFVDYVLSMFLTSAYGLKEECSQQNTYRRAEHIDPDNGERAATGEERGPQAAS